MELLTNSRLSKFRRCPRAHYYRYELELARAVEDAPLRMGSAFHLGLEVWNRTGDAANGATAAVQQSTAGYDVTPPGIDAADWAIERVTVEALVCGHLWRYAADGVRIVDVELKFEYPLMNPETNAVSRTFRMAGKIDAVAELPDGRLALVEYKTAGEDIGPDADYWLRLRCDPQISLYYEVLPALGHEVSTILYDATRKPTIGPRNVPVVDDGGFPIVLDQAGNRVLTASGKPRKTGSTADGYVLQTRRETPAEFSERLMADMGVRPDFYFQRREVARPADALETAAFERWAMAQQIIEVRRRSEKCRRPDAAWFRNVGRTTCDCCEFARVCLNDISVGPDDVPSGYVRRPANVELNS